MLYLHHYLTSSEKSIPQESSDIVLTNLFADSRQNMTRTLQIWFEINDFSEIQKSENIGCSSGPGNTGRSSGNTECDSGNTRGSETQETNFGNTTAFLASPIKY